MIIGTARLKLYAPWVHSLKEKRIIVKSIIAKTKNKFNVSIAEIDEQDRHQTIVLGVACVTDTVTRSDAIIDKVIKFIESSNQPEIQEVRRELR